MKGQQQIVVDTRDSDGGERTGAAVRARGPSNEWHRRAAEDVGTW